RSRRDGLLRDGFRREWSGSDRKQQCRLLHGPSPSLSLRCPHEARAQIGKSCGANGASPLGQRCSPRLLFLRRDVREPPVELGRAVARIRAGDERLIVQFDTEIIDLWPGLVYATPGPVVGGGKALPRAA